jgi:hypothetical protein
MCIKKWTFFQNRGFSCSLSIEAGVKSKTKLSKRVIMALMHGDIREFMIALETPEDSS